MSLFRRRRPGRHADDRQVFVDNDVPADSEGGGDEDDAIESFIDGLVDETLDGGSDGRVGPYDEEDEPDDELARLDLGSLRIPIMPDVEVRLYQETGMLELVAGRSSMQVSAYAAPRSSGIWDEVRADMVTGIGAQGGRCEETKGEYGTEVRARIRTEQGPTVVRIVGVDGPRWFVKAEFRGVAATDPEAAAPLLACLQGVVVVRGSEARPVRESLPLHPPSDATSPGDDEPATDAKRTVRDRRRA